MSEERAAVVVGAGIGGLATAALLTADGWKVTVVEKTPDAEPVGAAVALWSNAFRALELVDPQRCDEIRQRGSLRGQGGIRTPEGDFLARFDAEALHRRVGGPPVLVGRPELHELLLAKVPARAVLFGVTVTDVLQSPEQAVVSTSDGRHLEAELVVAADGIGSRLRTLVDPASRVESAGYVTWRGLVPAGAVTPDDGGETWGRGQRFGYMALSDDRIYWYATLAGTDSRLWEQTSGSMELDHLQHLFAEWHEPIPALLQATPIGAVLRHDVACVWPLPEAYVSGRLALVGDAAHAMTPDLAQGACQALEDAVELAWAVRSSTDLAAGLRTYDRRRRPRTARLAARARTLSRVSQLDRPLAASVRDVMVRMMPKSLALKGFESAAEWRPPA